MLTENFQMLKLDLEKAEEPEIKLPTFAGSSKNQGMGIPDHITYLLRNMYAGQETIVRT